MTTRTYDPNRVKIILGGIPMQGFADGTFLEIAYVSDQFGEVAGTDGEVSRSKTNDGRAEVTIRLMQTSRTNDALSALVNSDLAADGGAGIGAFLVTDLSGTTLLSSENAWIKKIPDQQFGREATERAWTIMCDNLVSFIGGNL